MGYTTDFNGEFLVTPLLKPEHVAYINQFAGTRRMQRDTQVVSGMPDPIREAVGLGVGAEGAYFVGGTGMAGQNHDPSVMSYNSPPDNQPGLWCQWVATEEGESIIWDQGEKFYNYVEWIEYLIEHFFKPWGYTLNGEMSWQGEDPGDIGIINIKDNVVRVQEGHIVYDPIEELNEGDNEFVANEGNKGFVEMPEEYEGHPIHLPEEEEGFTPQDVELLKFAVRFARSHVDYDYFDVYYGGKPMSCEEIVEELGNLMKKLGDQ